MDPELLFSDPSPDPPAAPRPYTGGPPTVAGDLDPAMAGRPLKELCAKVTGLGEAEAAELVRFGAAWVGSRQKTDPEMPLPESGDFRVNLPAYGLLRFYEADPERIVYEDDHVLVYDKESGRPSQGVPHDAHNNALSALERLTGCSLRLPHRLDAGTSGLLMTAKTREAAGELGKSFQKGRVAKRYVALSAGEGPEWDETEADASIAKNAGKLVARANGPGLAARTTLRVLARRGPKTLFLAVPHTGRTHQIRLHLSFLGCPVAGDRFYGGVPARRLMLRATGLAFPHPATGQVVVLGEPWRGEDGGRM
jgi:RluA family pseudouridine synthase